MQYATLVSTPHGRVGSTIRDTFYRLRAPMVAGGTPTSPPVTTQAELRQVERLGQFWMDKGIGTDEIVHAYLSCNTDKVHRTFSQLAGTKLGEEVLLRQIHEKRRQAMQVLGPARAEVMLSNPAVLPEVEADIAGSIEYAQAVVRTATGDLDMTTPQALRVLAGMLGNIPEWVRCYLSGNHPSVLENHGAEAAAYLLENPALIMALRNKNYDVQPVFNRLKKPSQ
jgi:hypothetical protein